MSSDHLTRPERSCSRSQARDVRALVVEDGGCCYCTKRAGLFETVGRRAVCGLTPPQQFPKCLDSGQFEFDEERFNATSGYQPFQGQL
ncbi:MAG TPA: hypothetical protein VGE09_06460 [Pseudoxanthomonas sp.]